MKCVIFCVIVCWMSVASSGDSSTLTDDVMSRGNALLQFGKKFNKPLFKILGTSLVDIESDMKSNKLETELHTKNNTDTIQSLVYELCRNLQCTDWSMWSACYGSQVGALNMATRSRTCGVNSICPKTYRNSVKMETDVRLCEVTSITCPSDYHRTTNGFCLQYFTSKYNNFDAEKTCQQHGGHLVNINSQAKSDDVNQYLTSQGSSTDVWIDGVRTSLSSPWQYRYGQAPQTAGFTNWDQLNSHPHNFTGDLCQLDDYRSDRKSWFWWSEACTYGTHFVCEHI